jgi:hypothetical protein
MKLAEALSERKSLIGKMEAVKKQAAEQFIKTDPEDKVNTALTLTTTEALKELAVRLTSLICNINLTNNQALVEITPGKEMTLMSVIANKDSRVLLLQQYEKLRDELNSRDYYREAQHHNCDLPVLHKEIAALKEEIRGIDLKIQEANWKFDLIEEAKKF